MKPTGRSTARQAWTAVLFSLRNESGLAHLVYHAAFVPTFDKANPLLLLTYDNAWVKRYVERDCFRIDPVVLAGRKSFLPIDWLTVEHSSKEARHFFAEAESYGVGRHGFTLPIRGPAGERALFTITTNAPMRTGIAGASPICGIFTFWRIISMIGLCALLVCDTPTSCGPRRHAKSNA